HRVLGEPDRIPLAELDDVVLDLDPRRAANHDVDLFLPLVLVTEGDAEVRRELHETQAERLAVERPAGKASFELGRHPEVRCLVLNFPEVLLRIGAHSGISDRDAQTKNVATVTLHVSRRRTTDGSDRPTLEVPIQLKRRRSARSSPSRRSRREEMQNAVSNNPNASVTAFAGAVTILLVWGAGMAGLPV